VPVPTQEDIILATLGAAAGLAGLVLVFLGIVVTAVQSYTGDTGGRVKRKYVIVGWGTFALFALSLATVLAAFVWLVDGGGILYGAAITLFVAVLIGMAGLGLAVMKVLIG
jgi:hypothetical protein